MAQLRVKEEIVKTAQPARTQVKQEHIWILSVWTVPPARRHLLVVFRKATARTYAQQAGQDPQALARSVPAASTSRRLESEVVCLVLLTHTALSQDNRCARAMPASRKTVAHAQVAVLGHTRRRKATENAQAVVQERPRQQAQQHRDLHVYRAKLANTQQVLLYASTVRQIQHPPLRAVQ